MLSLIKFILKKIINFFLKILFLKDFSNFLSFKDFYKLYKFFNKYNLILENKFSKNNFWWLIVYSYLFYNNFKLKFQYVNEEDNINIPSRFIKICDSNKFKYSFYKLFCSILFFNKTNKIYSLNLLSNNNIYKIYKIDDYSNLYFLEWYYKKPQPIIVQPKFKKYSNNIENIDGLGFYKNFFNNIYKYIKLKVIYFGRNFLPTSTYFKTIICYLQSNIYIKYAPTNISKYINYSNYDFEVQFLRKNKVFNKGRYSRNRQNYRTGVYMCLYVSILSLYGIYYMFYKFSFNFSYLWLGFFFFIASFFIPKFIKYRLYDPYILSYKIFEVNKWLFFVFNKLFFKVFKK